MITTTLSEQKLIRCVMKELLNPRPWRVCLIRHIAAKVAFFRGNEAYSPCLHCPQVLDALVSTATDTQSEVKSEMTTKSGKKDKRITCKTCKKEDVFDFSKGNCRGCHFAIKEGRTPGGIEKAKPGTIAECEICGRSVKIATSGRCWKCYKKHGLDPVDQVEPPTENPVEEVKPEPGPEVSLPQPEEKPVPQMLFSMAFLEEKQNELERLESSAEHQEKLLDLMRIKISVLRPLVEGLSLAIEYDKTGALF